MVEEGKNKLNSIPYCILGFKVRQYDSIPFVASLSSLINYMQLVKLSFNILSAYSICIIQKKNCSIYRTAFQPGMEYGCH